MNRDTFLKLFLPAQPTLRSFIFSMVRNINEMEDIFQDVSMTLWEKFDHYDPSRPFTPWAIGVARNYVSRWRRRQGRSLLTFVPELEVALEEDFALLESELIERRRALENCVASLDEKARKTVRLRYEENLSLHEIANCESRSLNAVNKALSKIRALLLACTKKTLRSV